MYENKLHIEIFILIFMSIVISLCILFSLYYVSSANYVLYDFEPSNSITLTKEYIIEPNKQKTIKSCRYPNKVFRVLGDGIDHVPIVLENSFKSENIYINKNKLIKLANSDLIIKNTTGKTLKITLEVYSAPGLS